jgi:hypothetical protein
MIAALVVVGLLVLVPGAGASLAVARPGGLSIESRIALAFGLGYGLVAGVATLLALMHMFSRPAFIVGLVLATAAVWSLALRRTPWREHGARFVEQARAAPYVLGAGLTLLLAVAVTRLLYPIENSLAIRSSWRYWADGLEVAARGHVPTTAAQWGTEIPATVSKVVFNDFEGGISHFLGPGPLPAMKAILTLTAIGLAAALLGLARELGLGITAPLVPALIVLVPDWLPLSHEVTTDLKLFTAEGVGRMACFCAVLVGIYALRGPDRWMPAIVAGALMALAGLTHLVPTLVAGAVLVLYAIAFVIVDRPRLRPALARGGVALLAFVVCYVGILGLSGGDLGLQRATSNAGFAGLPANVDPTLSFAHGAYVDKQPVHGHFFISPRDIVARYSEETIDKPTYGTVGLGFLALLGIGTVVAVWLRRELFLICAVAWGLVAIILAVTFFFSYRYDTLIPANFGVRRLYDYVIIPPALLLPAIVEAIAYRLAGRWRALLPAVAVAAGVLAVAAAIVRVPSDRTLGRAEAGKQVMARVADHVPCGARMLANTRTAGTWEAWTGRGAITEGMSPFLRPEVMGRILPILIGANDFFKDPQANRDYLAKERVQYLVTVSPGIWFGWGGTGRDPQADDAEKVAALPGVTQVYRDPRVSIFAVGQNDASADGGQPARCSV